MARLCVCVRVQNTVKEQKGMRRGLDEGKKGMKREKHFSRRAGGWTLAETRRGEMKKEKNKGVEHERGGDKEGDGR